MKSGQTADDFVATTNSRPALWRRSRLLLNAAEKTPWRPHIRFGAEQEVDIFPIAVDGDRGKLLMGTSKIGASLHVQINSRFSRSERGVGMDSLASSI